MTLYRYEAAAMTGDLVKGEMDAQDEAGVIARLHAEGYIPIRAEAAGRHWLFRELSLPAWRPAKPRRQGIAFLTRQLSLLLSAGLPLDRALEIAADVMPRTVERKLVDGLLEDLRGGRSLADAMAGRKGIFPVHYIGMVRAGEAGATLAVTLSRLASFLDRAEAAREQVKSALIYPVMVLVTGLGSMAILFGFVLPRFRPLFEEAGAALPFSTRIVLALSDGVTHYGWLMLVLLAAVGIGARHALATQAGRLFFDTHVLRLPILGDLVTRLEVSRFAHMLGTLLKSGVAPIAALAITEKSMGNRAMRDVMPTVIESVKDGKGLSRPLSESGLFPDLAVQLARVGEETARLDDMLLKTAEIYEETAKRDVERLLALLVPAVTIGLGVLVALVVGSILSAVLSAYNLAM